MHNFLEEIDYGEGVLHKLLHSYIPISKDLTFEEVLKLDEDYIIDEDFAYIQYDYGLGIDVGLYGNEGNKFFQVSVVRGDWSSPRPFLVQTRNISRLVKLMKRAVEIVQELREIEQNRIQIFETVDFKKGVIEKIIGFEVYDKKYFEVNKEGDYVSSFYVEYDHNFIIDFRLGRGRMYGKYFLLQMIEDGNWATPRLIEKYDSYELAKQKLEDAVAMLQEYRKKGVFGGKSQN